MMAGWVDGPIELPDRVGEGPGGGVVCPSLRAVPVGDVDAFPSMMMLLSPSDGHRPLVDGEVVGF